MKDKEESLTFSPIPNSSQIFPFLSISIYDIFIITMGEKYEGEKVVQTSLYMSGPFHTAISFFHEIFADWMQEICAVPYGTYGF